MKKRLLIILTVICMIVSLVPTVLADDAYVAEVGTTKYTDLQDAIDDVGDTGDTVKMLQNVQLIGTGLTVAQGGNVRIDLNGYVISGISNAAASTALINNKGTLVIDDTSAAGTGKITSSATNPDTQWVAGFPAYANNTINNTGHLTIDGGRIENATGEGYCIPIDNLGGTLIVNDGHIVHLDGQDAIRLWCNSTTTASKVEINGGTIEGGYYAVWVHVPGSSAASEKMGELTVNGGTLSGKEGEPAISVYSFGDSFEKINVSIEGGDFISKAIEYGFAAGKENSSLPTIEVSGGSFIETDTEVGNYLVPGTELSSEGKVVPTEGSVAAVGSVGYASLKAAVDAAEDGDVVTLLADDTASEIIVIDKAITLNGNNKTLTSSADRAINVNCAGKVEIKDLIILTTRNASADIRAINVIQKPADLTLTNVRASGFKYTINVAASSVGSEITIDGGSYSGYAALNITGSDTTVNAEDVEFIGVNPYDDPDNNSFSAVAIGDFTSGNKTENVTINITGGSITAKATGEAEQVCFGFGVMPDGSVVAPNLSANLNTEWILEGANTAYIGVPEEVDAKYITGGTFADDSASAYVADDCYAVTYKADGNIVAVVVVAHGEDATAPEVPEKEGYTGSWDKDGKNITADTEILAVYEDNSVPAPSPSAPAPSNPPQNGDSGILWLCVALLVVSGGCVIGFSLNKSRKNDN